MDQILLQSLQRYKEENSSETARVSKLEDLILTRKDCFLRTSPDHLTASAFAVNPDKSKVLLIFHAKLQKWLQPGGHADGERDLSKVAMNELEEETGAVGSLILTNNELIPFDVSIHEIPARKDEPSHQHYDIRYLVEVDDTVPLIQNEESEDVQWFTLDEARVLCAENSSIIRMLQKLRKK